MSAGVMLLIEVQQLTVHQLPGLPGFSPPTLLGRPFVCTILHGLTLPGHIVIMQAAQKECLPFSQDGNNIAAWAQLMHNSGHT